MRLYEITKLKEEHKNELLAHSSLKSRAFLGRSQLKQFDDIKALGIECEFDASRRTTDGLLIHGASDYTITVKPSGVVLNEHDLLRHKVVVEEGTWKLYFEFRLSEKEWEKIQELKENRTVEIPCLILRTNIGIFLMSAANVPVLTGNVAFPI